MAAAHCWTGAVLALSGEATTGLFGVAIAFVGVVGTVVTVLLNRSTKQEARAASAGVESLRRDHEDCNDALAWVVGVMENNGIPLPDPLPGAVVRARARAKLRESGIDA